MSLPLSLILLPKCSWQEKQGVVGKGATVQTSNLLYGWVLTPPPSPFLLRVCPVVLYVRFLLLAAHDEDDEDDDTHEIKMEGRKGERGLVFCHGRRRRR